MVWNSAHSDKPLPSERGGEASGSGSGASDVMFGGLSWQPVTGLPAPVESVDELPLPLKSSTKEQGLAKKLLAPPRDPRIQSRMDQKAKVDTAGSQWYNMPAPVITDDVKRDLRLLCLRNAFDTKRFYKNFDTTKFPKYFQFGTVIEGPTEFYSGRIVKRERKSTITEELLADTQLTQSRKKRYDKLQAEATKWSKKNKRKTSNPRINKKPKKPKH